MIKLKLIIFTLFSSFVGFAQLTNPIITKWLQNTTTTGSYYMSGNSTAISNGILVNCQEVSYNTATNWAYIKATGIPAYKVGPFIGNPGQAGNQNAIFRFPLIPTQNTGTLTPTSAGNIGIFVNGVAMFDFGDGVAWSTTSNSPCGGPPVVYPACIGTTYWRRDAVLAEMSGFDCSKGHPAIANYHHHQNPSAFKLDLNILSTICNLYDADGLYTINTAQHSPLIGFGLDGFPVYGAYSYTNVNGTGAIARMKSGYQLRNITVRTHHADGTDVPDGPPVSATYPLGYYREDYEWIAHPSDPTYLDEHNGRICITPEYPSPPGIYCYFATVDANHNSAYPYLIGPTYYGNKTASKVLSIPAGVTIYTPAVLPITLLNFSGNIVDRNAILSWKTANEINSKAFIIQRSIDGVNFTNIGTVISVGNTSQNTNYNFTDKNIPTGRLYYRLQQVDLDGRTKLYNIISLVNNTSGYEFKVLPNPASDLIAIQYNGGVLEQDTYVKLFDVSGKLINQTTIYKGQTIAYFNIETLYSGTYIVRIQNNLLTESIKVIVQK